MAVLKNTVSSGALVLPSGTTAQRPASPAQGAMRFNTTLGVTEIYQYGGWVDAASGAESPSPGGTGGYVGGGAQTVCYIPMYGDSGTNADITDQVSGAVATLSGTTTRNYTRGGSVGLDFQGGYLDFISPLLGSINNSALPTIMNGRRFWTIEFWVWRTGGTGAATFMEFPYYPVGLMLRDGNLATDHYWRGSTINSGMTFTTGAWTHIAAVGYGDKIQFYDNGVQKYDGMNAVATSAFPDPYYQGSGTTVTGLSLMCSNHTTRGNQAAYGTLRKFRISVGARYLAAFTPATVYPI